MKEGDITSHELERIIDAVEHSMELKPIEEPQLRVQDLDSDNDDAHIVSLEKGNIHCSCPDYRYNCGTNQYCKHCYRAMFEYFRML